TFPFADDRYTYDLLGNRLTDQRQTPGETWQYNQNNELLYSGFATYQYNENGSTTAKQDPSTGQPIQSYAYNSEERMSEVRDAAGNLVAEYYYDPFGRRLWKTLYPAAGGRTSDYAFYSEEGLAFAGMWAASDSLTASVVIFEPSSFWGTGRIGSKVGSDVTLYFSEPNERLVLSKTGSSFSSTRFSEFGEYAGNVFGFSGLLMAPEISALEALFRVVEPRTGRFYQLDPSGLSDGPNMYIYSAASPTRMIDPLGLFGVYAQEICGLNGSHWEYKFYFNFPCVGPYPPDWNDIPSPTKWIKRFRKGQNSAFEPYWSGSNQVPIDKRCSCIKFDNELQDFFESKGHKTAYYTGLGGSALNESQASAMLDDLRREMRKQRKKDCDRPECEKVEDILHWNQLLEQARENGRKCIGKSFGAY
ncbi:RHS repeat domain-containing protein, partial [Pseudomarimonas arenosa]